jgi:hypothetical protein
MALNKITFLLVYNLEHQRYFGTQKMMLNDLWKFITIVFGHITNVKIDTNIVRKPLFKNKTYTIKYTSEDTWNINIELWMWKWFLRGTLKKGKKIRK